MKNCFLILTFALVCQAIAFGQFQYLEGKVSNIGNQPIDKVEVNLYSGTDLIQTAQTNKSGEFKFSVLPRTYSITFCHPDFVGMTFLEVLVWEGKTTFLFSELPTCSGFCCLPDVVIFSKMLYDQKDLTTNTTFSGYQIR